MKLSDFFKINKTKVNDFAMQVGVVRSAVYSYAKGEKVPSRETMQKIYKLTNGQVTPNDFYDLKTD